MKKFSWFDTAAVVVWFIPIIYLITIYPGLPAKVALHFDLHGMPDNYGTPSSLIGVQFLLSGVSLGIYLLLKYLPNIDPKKKVNYSAGMFKKMALGLVVFISVINLICLFASWKGHLEAGKLILPAIGLFFAFMGNVMHSIKPNYFAGIRTPWTLESEDTWRATHQLAGKMWFIGGLLIALLTLLLNGNMAHIFFMTAVGVLVIIPMIYSYIYFKKHQLKS